MDLGDEIFNFIDHEVPASAWTRFPGLFTSINEQVRDVQKAIEQTNTVTENQQQALQQWRASVERWVN